MVMFECYKTRKEQCNGYALKFGVVNATRYDIIPRWTAMISRKLRRMNCINSFLNFGKTLTESTNGYL